MQKNLNDIIPPSRRARMAEDGAPAETPLYGQPPRHTGRRVGAKRKFPLGTALVALVVVALSAGALYAFSGAKVEIAPTTNQATIESEFVATASVGDLPYEVISVDKVASDSVPAESTETVNQPAQGTIIVENQQPTAQQLIKNTRFETPSGLIYRIHDSITVPAAKGGTPGSLSVTAYADAAGEQYNVGPTTFTIPGLAGSKSFSLVTARSKDAMSGGFSGTRPTVSQATRDAETAKLATALETDLASGIKGKIPEGYVLVPGSIFTTTVPQPDQPAAGGNVTVATKGTATAVIFPSAALAKSIAYKSVGSYAGQPVTLGDVSSLKLTPATASAPVDGQDFPFTLSGSASVVWTVEPDKIAAAVAGKTRDSAQVLLSGFPEIDRASLILRPFWRQTYPADPSKITVTVETSKTAS